MSGLHNEQRRYLKLRVCLTTRRVCVYINVLFTLSMVHSPVLTHPILCHRGGIIFPVLLMMIKREIFLFFIFPLRRSDSAKRCVWNHNSGPKNTNPLPNS